MRRFVVTSPNLTVGSPGDIVDADELYMDDDQLDEWCDAGYGMELYGDTAIGDVLAHMADTFTEVPTYDPSAHSVPDVRRYVDENPDHADAIIQAERDGQNRSGIVNGW